MGESHTEGAEKGLFCSLREEECPCGNKYQNIMIGTESWGKYPQKHRVLKAVERSPEAHHVLPVAAVTGEVTCNEDIKKAVIENTKWCVNDLENMIALPLFEMTFLHYLIQEETSKPDFKDLPMHNYDHPAFQQEVGEALKKIGKNTAENTKKHEAVSAELLSAMNKARGRYKKELGKRGKRGDGTHDEFINAMDAQENNRTIGEWYLPFSMADEPAAKPFPSSGGKSGLSKKLADLTKAWEIFSGL